jgi:hypothetical protein
MAKAFTPATGWNDEATFLDEPVDPRGDLQKLHDQMLGFHNEHLADSAIYLTRDGAVGDGSDETTKIQSVFDDAEGKNIYVPANKTFVASQIKFPDNCIIVGENKETSILKQLANTNLPFFERKNAIRGNFEMSNVTVDGNKANQTTRNRALNFTSNNVDIKNVKFINTIEEAIYADCDEKLRIHLCDFSDMAEHSGIAGEVSLAVKSVGTGRFIFVKNKVTADAPSVAGRAPGGIEISATSSDPWICDNEFDGIGQYAQSNYIGSIDLYTNADTAIVVGNKFYNYRYVPLKLQNSGHLICKNNIVYSFADASGSHAMIYQGGVRSHTPVATDAIFEGNIILQSANIGLSIQGDSVGGNTKNIIISNTIIKNAAHGIYLQYVDGINISNSILDTTTAIGVEIENCTGRIATSKLSIDGCTSGIYARTSNLNAKFYIEGLKVLNASSLGVSFRTCDTLQMIGCDINSTGTCVDAVTITNGFFDNNIGNNAPTLSAITNRFDGMNSWNPGISWATAMPSSGAYVAGHIVYNKGVTKDASSMHVLGWRRITTSSNHVLDTDWYAMYVSTVSPAT